MIHLQKFTSFKIVAVVLLLALASCSQNRYVVAPPFTDIVKISALKKGMTLNEINSTLGVAPFNLFVTDEGYSIYSYNYRLKERRIPVNRIVTYMDRPNEPANNSINSEEAQKFGTDFYTDWKVVYVHLKDDKLSAVISDEGLERATHLAGIMGGLQELRKDPQFKILPDKLLSNNVIIPLDDKGNYLQNNNFVSDGKGGTVAAPGFIFLGNNQGGIVTYPETYPRRINGAQYRKTRFSFFGKAKARSNRARAEAEIRGNYESDND